ncbi:beta-L-N-acetylhexosaminidase family protein [Alistipes sp. CAG:29]|uniref:glycoside hydrolase family 20 protein n=1 Tax=Alistipes sp. CAG:29 TaxID=1262694 RepID=UPI00033DF3CE|nr:family 20 glycosylhydrolase [Alistipes sp. CAG:29]CDD25795.1 beta-L-N-acetylhexosaminidase family protein [Alistipes sp. CAG:29]
MKKLLLAFAAGVCLSACATHDPKISIVPYPNHLEPGHGTFAVKGEGVVCDSRADERTQRAVAEFAAQLAKTSGGENPVTVADELPASGIRFVLDQTLPEEGYRLDVTPKGVEVRASRFPGFFYAVQSLRQMLPAAVYGTEPAPGEEWVLPCVSIEDAPRFAYRGMHLDVARHFFSVEEVKRYLDVMAIHKLNRFHWHLTDGAGWRIEIKKYPALTDIAAWRPYPDWGEWNFGGKRYCHRDDPVAAGGYYTQDDIREVVEYARALHIEVIPEIEMPGHSEEVLAVYPELSCSGKPYTDSDFCIGNEQTFEFLENVLSEVIGLFPSEYIHIGGDEASKRGWRTCPECAARMRREGLKDVDELQSYLVHRIGTFLAARGRRLLGWDEILQGGLAPGATVMSWRGTEGGIAAARAGHRAVMAPSNYCYLDFCQDDPTREPVAAAAFLTLAQAYSYDPAPDSLGADVVPMILGVQGNLWCEHVPTAEHAEHMIWPRLLAIAEVGWSAPERKDFDDFHARVLDAVAWMQQRGYHPFDQKNAVGPRPESLDTLHCLSTGRQVAYRTPYSPKYPAAGDASLTDGLRGGWNYGDRRWQGWLDTDVELVVDLGERLPVKRIAACFMQGFYADIWMPRAVEISVSDDDRHYTPLASVENDIPFEYKQDCYREFGWSGQTAARYVRLKALHNGHPGGWIFTDEIIVE